MIKVCNEIFDRIETILWYLFVFTLITFLIYILYKMFIFHPYIFLAIIFLFGIKINIKIPDKKQDPVKNKND